MIHKSEANRGHKSRFIYTFHMIESPVSSPVLLSSFSRSKSTRLLLQFFSSADLALHLLPSCPLRKMELSTSESVYLSLKEKRVWVGEKKRRAIELILLSSSFRSEKNWLQPEAGKKGFERLFDDHSDQ